MFAIKSFLLVSLVSCTIRGYYSFDYDQQGDDWNQGVCQKGRSQSPIELLNWGSELHSIPAIEFHNYNIPLRGALKVVNVGHSAEVSLPETTNGKRAYISGGLLPGNFEVDSVHFHWGSLNSQGSEHTIDRVRYDVEMHIVHKNTKYASKKEALSNADGLAVLGVLFKSSPVALANQGLNKIINQLPSIRQYNSSAQIQGDLRVGDLIKNVYTGKFFSYNGSLTTPPCAEAVTWSVFSNVIPMARSQIAKFWNLLDQRDEPLVNNYRKLQDINNRSVYQKRILF